MDQALFQNDLLGSVKATLLAPGGTTALEAALRSPAGPMLRTKIANAIVDHLVPVNFLVPDCYRDWRLPVRDAMCFVVSRLSPPRLAPKVVEQLQLPADTPPERRLLHLIAKVPGLQKLGQVIARNRGLRPELRRALIELENGIRDTTLEEACTAIRHELGQRIATYEIDIEPRVLSEASVSTVVRFKWRNLQGRREAGVFKVLKSHVPAYFQEDMEILQELANVFATRTRQYGRAARVLPDTFAKVRRLLQHEVDYPGEQRALLRAADFYRTMRRVRVPTLIPSLCTAVVTAMTEAPGGKVVDTVRRVPVKSRRVIAESLVDAFVIAPLFASEPCAMFHADPHAGNLLFDHVTGQLTIVDWALKEELTREQRRRLALLMCFVALRDPLGATEQILKLSQRCIAPGSTRGRAIREHVASFIDELPLTTIPGPVDAMQLLENCALQGVRFPGSLIMFSKMMFTLEDVLADITARTTSLATIVGRHLLTRLVDDRTAVALPLENKDWLSLQCSSLLWVGRLGVRIEQGLLNKVLRTGPALA